MRAVVRSGPGYVAVADVPRPEAAADEVLVRVAAAAVCSTDAKLVRAGGPTPRVLGHEVTGYLADGSPVGIYPEITCGTCAACRSGWENRCPARGSIGIDRDGGMAELAAMPRTHAVSLDGVDPVAGAMLEPLACVLHAVAMSGLPKGAPAAVVGAGATGVLSTWALQRSGSRVVVCQRSPQRRDLALQLGADAVVTPEDDPRPHLDGSPEAAVVTAPGAEPLRWALENVAPGGTIHVFAGTPGGARIDANLVHYRHLRVTGSTGSRLQDYLRARDLAATGEINLARLPHQVIELEQVPAVLLEGTPPAVLKTLVAVGGRE